MDEEIWKAVPGYETYQVSNLGRLKLESGRISRAKPYKDGYVRVALRDSNRVEWFTMLQHVVCFTFHGPKPFPKALCLHKNDIGTDNREVNLYWGTHQNNMDDRACNNVKYGKNIF